MIHCVIITNSTGNLLFSRYYNGSTEEEQFLWECKMYELTKDEWALAKGEKPQVSIDNEKHIIYSGVGDLFVFATGSGEDDELVLLEVISTLTEVLKGVCKKGAVSEAALLECYPKLVIYVDEMIKRGIVDILQYEQLYLYKNMKHDQVPKSSVK